MMHFPDADKLTDAGTTRTKIGVQALALQAIEAGTLPAC